MVRRRKFWDKSVEDGLELGAQVLYILRGKLIMARYLYMSTLHKSHYHEGSMEQPGLRGPCINTKCCTSS